MARQKPRPCWDVALIVSDMSQRGWNTAALARAAGLTYKTADRFLRGTVQTPKTAAKIASAFGYATTRRYLLHVEAVA